MGDIRSTADKILSGTLDIINWMKYNNSRVALDKHPVNLYQLVDEVCHIFEPIAAKKDIPLLNNVSSSTYADIDATIFSIILNNLVSNAIKYSTKGQVAITAEAGAGGSIFLKISDTGKGMTDDQLKAIHEILQHNVQTIGSTVSGTGLGLYTCCRTS